MQLGTIGGSGAIVLALWTMGCVASEHELVPADLDVRDLLGLSPSVAARWGADDRASARAALMAAWVESRRDGGSAMFEEVASPDPGADGLLAALSASDGRRAGAGQEPVVVGLAELAGTVLRLEIASPDELDLDRGDGGAPGHEHELELVDWAPDEIGLERRGTGWLVRLASVAGHPDGAPIRVRAARHAPFGAVYLGTEAAILVNPVLLAALEPTLPEIVAVESAARIGGGAGGPGPTERGSSRSPPVASGGNPYSFYGSVAECAAAQRLRCESCLPSASCERTARGAPDGNAECTTLGGDGGRGYYLYCVNLSLAIATVAECVREEGPSCPQDVEASNQIERLGVNGVFVDEAACGDALDDCLTAIFGEPGGDFPGPVPDAGPEQDGGAPPPPAPQPPREIDVSCGEADCEFSPQCDSSCSGNCDTIFSCDADCGGGGGDGDDSGGDGSGGGCDCGGEGSGGGGGDGGGSDCGGGDCESGSDCGGSDCGGDSCGGDCSGCDGGSENSCAAARQARRMETGAGLVCRRRPGDAGALLALAWAILPLSYLERSRRRARRGRLGRAHPDARP